MVFSKWLINHRMLKRLAKALIRLRVCAGWSEALLVAHTTLLETSCTGSASFSHLGLNSIPLNVLKFHNGTHDPKRQETYKPLFPASFQHIYRLLITTTINDFHNDQSSLIAWSVIIALHNHVFYLFVHVCLKSTKYSLLLNLSEYEQDISQAHTVYQSTASLGRGNSHMASIRQYKQNNQLPLPKWNDYKSG